jgi:biopolymer transport protein ExbB/biopolymer transport protein TolQ
VFDIAEIWSHASFEAKIIIVTMFLMGLASIFVAIERAIVLIKSRNSSRELAGAIGQHFADGNAKAALQVAEDEQYKNAYLSRTLQAGLREFIARPNRDGVLAAQRAIDRAHIDEDSALRRGFGILATTGATCPFVGLVGTILGIIGAFKVMSEGGGDLDKLLLPIGEALIATAIGITVAIIGVWLFNFFNGMVGAIIKDITTSELELIDWFEKQLLDSAESAAK